MQFEWNPAKERLNAGKHGVTFHEAATVFGDPLAVTFHDPDHSGDEDRLITVGRTDSGRLVMVAHADRKGRIRVISARELTARERKAYEQANK